MTKKEFDEIKRMIDFMDEHGLEEFELEGKDGRVRLRKPLTREELPLAERSTGETPSLSAHSTTGSSSSGENEDVEGLVFVKSPIVGTFYRSPDPSADPFVEVGSVVRKGQTLCIVEAMKLMNEIDSEFDGEIATVFFENGQPIQYGDKLFAIRSK